MGNCLSLGKYANEILQRFCMESFKPIEKRLVNNWRKEDTTLGEEVDATIDRKLVGSHISCEHMTIYTLCSQLAKQIYS